MNFDHLLPSNLDSLLPGSVLVSIFREPNTQDALRYDFDQLSEFNNMALLDAIDFFYSHSYLTQKQQATLKDVILSFEDAYQTSTLSLEYRAFGYGYDSHCADIIFRNTLSIKLFLHLLQIATPVKETYMKIDSSDVDIIEMMEHGAINFVAGLWAKLAPRHQGIVKSFGTRQLWRAAIQDTGTECLSVIEDGVQIIKDDGVAEFRQLIEVEEIFDELNNYYEINDKIVSDGLDNEFSCLGLGCSILGLPPICLAFLYKQCAEIAWSYAQIDGSVSHSESRFVENLTGRLLEQFEEFCSEAEDESGAVKEEDFEAVLAELDSMIGLESVKTKVREVANLARVQQMRSAQGLKMVKSNLHTVYFGNPGTGKTTVARLMGRIYRSLGILQSGHLIECDRSKLVAEYVGQTAIKTNEVIDSALDGILFIDEAYSLSGKGETDFGKEAIDTLLKRMEDERGRLIVIVAGYSDDMHQFISSNPGLQSRFTNYIEFPDYNATELCRIFSSMVEQNELVITPELKALLLFHYTMIDKNRAHHFGNARDVRNLFESSVTRQASRLSKSGNFERDALSLLVGEDLMSEHISAEMFAKPFECVSNAVCICPSCKHVFSWDVTSELIEAQCSSCQKSFNVEFGRL